MSQYWCVLRSLLFLLLSISFSSIQISAQVQVQPRVVQAVDNAQRVTLKGNVHALARAEFDRGAVADSLPMTRILLLLKRGDDQEAALRDFLEKQQDKNSPSYHSWLTPQEFGAQYGPADADILAVTQWLGSQGFSIQKVYSGKTVIEFSGTAGQVRAAFGAAIRNYQVNGKGYVANTNDPQVPAALAPVVSGIVSLNNFPREPHVRYVGQARKKTGQGGIEPLFTFPLGSGNFYGLGPGDFATIYNSKPLITSGNDGTGQTIAIVGQTNIHLQDVQNFRTMFGLPATFTQANVILNGEDPGITSTREEGEADLDVEWSGAVAPGATVQFVVSASTPASAGIDLSALYIIEQNLAGVMSESYGGCEPGLGSAGNAFYNSLWEEAAAQGITAVLSAGDGGSAGCDDFNTATKATNGLAVSGLASTPFNVSVGGTDFDQVNKWSLYWSTTNSGTGDATGTSALGYIPEIPWNQSCAQLGLSGCGTSAPNGSMNIVAGSGGPSSVYAKPKWQMGVTGMPNDSHRDQPDVALFASPGFNGTGYIYCQVDQTFSVSTTCDINNPSGTLDFGIIGGTSAAAPAFAGVMALVNQYQAAHGGNPRQGNANYVLYQLAKKAGASCASVSPQTAGCIFNDVVKGNSEFTGGVGTNSVPCQGGTANCSSTTGTGVLVDPSHTTTEAWTVTSGYDMATGLGTINANNLVTNWGTVSTVPTTTTLTLSPTTGITHGTGENVTVNISVTPSSGTATGDVSLIATLPGPNNTTTTEGLDQFTLANGKVVNGTTKSLPGGTSYMVTVHYAGDGTNAPSDSAPVTVTVGQESSQTFIVIPSFDAGGNQISGNASSVSYGSRYIIRMYVTDKNAVASAAGPPSPACYQENIVTCPNGTVKLTDGGSPVDAGTFSMNNVGYTRDIAPNLPGGTHALSAQYSGDNSYQGSTSTATTFTVIPTATQTQLTYYPSNAVLGQPFLLQASVSSQTVVGSAPGGTVTFYDGKTALPGTVTLNSQPGSVSAFLNTNFSTTGPQSITAQYSGDGNYAPSISTAVTINSQIPTAITQSESATSINYGQTITVTATVISSSKSPPMTGQIQFSGPYVTFTGVTTTTGTDANGNQILTTTATTAPQFTGYIGANYAGDANYAPASSAGVIINVNIPDFSLPSVVNLTATAGQTGTATMNVTPLTNIPSPVTLLAQGTAPVGTTLTVSPTMVNLNGSPVPVSLTLMTTMPSGGPANAIAHAQTRKAGVFTIARGDWWSLIAAGTVFALYVIGIPRRRRRYKRVLLLTMMVEIGFGLGCGGGGGNGGGGGRGGGGPVATTIAMTTSNAKVAAGAPFTFAATVTSTKSITGTVTFYQGQQAIAPPVAVGAGGVATLPVPNSYPVGIFDFSASYSGDASNMPSKTTTGVNEVFTGSTQVTISGQTGQLSHSANLTITLQ